MRPAHGFPHPWMSKLTSLLGPSDNSSLYSIIWSLCNAIGLLLTGRLSDKFGRRYFVLGAGVLAIVGGIVACTAKTMNTLIGANVSCHHARWTTPSSHS